MAEPLDEPLNVVARGELTNYSARLSETLEAMEVEALLLGLDHTKEMTPFHASLFHEGLGRVKTATDGPEGRLL